MGETAGERDEGVRGDGSRRAVVVGLLYDPDLPEQVAHRLAGELPAALEAEIRDDVSWQVRAARDPFEVAAADSGRLVDKARDRVRHTEWDLAICLTDLPLWSGKRPLVVSVVDEARVAIVSVPALGGFSLRRRARNVIVPVIARLAAAVAEQEAVGVQPYQRVARYRLGLSQPATPVRPRDEDVDVELATPRGHGRLRLLAGMVRANQPWRLALGLSAALAAGLAGSAFGVLYSNIWQLATALGTIRLALFAVAAVVLMAGYLIVGHGLWEGATVRERGGNGVLMNAATLFTVAFGTAIFFIALIVMNLAAVLLVIPPDYLQSVLSRPFGWTDYLTLAVMASAMGTVAGAVGSGLENDATVRSAAYSYRESRRREQIRSEVDD